MTLEEIDAEVEQCLQGCSSELIQLAIAKFAEVKNNPMQSWDLDFVTTSYELALRRYAAAKVLLHRKKRYLENCWGSVNGRDEIAVLELDVLHFHTANYREYKNRLKSRLLHLGLTHPDIKYLQQTLSK